jgi:hypothetical protein
MRLPYSTLALLFTLLLIFHCKVQLCAGIRIEDFFEQRCSRENGGFVTQNFENWVSFTVVIRNFLRFNRNRSLQYVQEYIYHLYYS